MPARVLVAPPTQDRLHTYPSHCMSSWGKVWMSPEKLQILWKDKGRPVLCVNCYLSLAEKGQVPR